MIARGRAATLAGVGVAMALALGGSDPPATTEVADGGRAATAPAAPATVAEADQFRSVRSYHPAGTPVRLRIPAALVDTELQPLDRLADGSIDVPRDPATAGWYKDGPRPGQPGPAVMLGHVDGPRGPAVFFHLAELPLGAAVYVDTSDRRTETFRVTGLTRVPKADFPTDLVYAPTLESSLRLVTCGGSFDAATGHYRDNVIVYAAAA